MILLEEIDFIQTRKNARKALREFRKLNRMAGRSAIHLKSPTLSDMPRTPKTAKNGIQDAMIDYLNAEQERDELENAIRSLSLVSRQILVLSFCEMERHTNYEIGQVIKTYKADSPNETVIGGFSKRHIERLKGIALVEFAESYKGGALIAYKG